MELSEYKITLCNEMTEIWLTIMTIYDDIMRSKIMLDDGLASQGDTRELIYIDFPEYSGRLLIRLIRNYVILK